MAEGLAAVGLAGNIIQFISFGSELVSKTAEIHNSASGASSAFVDLDYVSESLKSLTEPFLNQSNTTQLREISERCNGVADELLEVIASLKVHSKSATKEPTKWQSFRKALKSIWKKEQVDALRLRLQLLRDQISLHLVSDTNKNQAHVLTLLETWKTYISQANRAMTTQISELDRRLHKIQQNTAQTFNDGDWARLHDMCTQVGVDVQLLFRRRTIIQSLRYECMESRTEAINNAHERTFEWMFTPVDSHGATPRPVSEFVQWYNTVLVSIGSLGNQVRHVLSVANILLMTKWQGSGKSTLMKYLFDDWRTTKHLQIWAGTTSLVPASFYFWIPGQKMQKSLEGLLQTLLFHILSACPDLVSLLCPERFDEQDIESSLLRAWTLVELQKIFQVFQLRNDDTAKFYFHIDGLDEYHGDSWEVIHTLQNLAACPNVKMCLSSRPWNSFQDAFGHCNPYVLRLHEWTKRDIAIFANETLMAFTLHSAFEPSLFSALIHDISERAQGVFLWVRLVVHSLRNGIVNDDPVSLLHERLRVIPTDLEDFFRHILESVENIYQSRMARAFLAATRASEPLTTYHYHFLDQEDTAVTSGHRVAPWTVTKIQQVVDQTHRRLNGRYRGLLEPSKSNATARHPRVDFLHRTLRDFLKTDRMLRWLKLRAATESNILLTMGRALVATQSVIDPKFIDDDLSTIKTVIEYASLATRETGKPHESHAVVDLAHDIYQGATKSHSKCGINCYIIHFALTVGHVDYLRHCLRKSGTKMDVNRILRHILCCPLNRENGLSPCLSETISIDILRSPAQYIGHDLVPDMINTLLDHGADPNAVIGSSQNWTVALRAAVAQMDSSDIETCLNILGVFLKRCHNLDFSQFEWNNLLTHRGVISEERMQNTLRLLEFLLWHGLDPNLVSQGTTLFCKFLRTLPSSASRPYINPTTAEQHQHKILVAFLRAGAEVAQVFKDKSAGTWFSRFSQDLSSGCLDQTTIAQLRLFLEQGLSLNSVLRGNITIWYWVLGLVFQSTQQEMQVENKHRAIHQLMLLSLRHGADPSAPGLPRILQWMKSRSCLLTAEEVTDMELFLPSTTLADAVAIGRKRRGDGDCVFHDASGVKKSKM